MEFCKTDDQRRPLSLFVQKLAEPRTSKDIETFGAYLARVQGKQLFGGELRFERIARVVVRTDLQAKLASPTTYNSVIYRHAERYDSFESLNAFFEYKAQNRPLFFGPMDGFLAWVETLFGSNIKTQFASYVLAKVNKVELNYERNYLLLDGNLAKNWLMEVHLSRDCQDYPRGRCM